MALLFNVCLILFGLAGVGAAVAAPIVMSTGNKASTTASQELSSSISTVSLDISECSNTSPSSNEKVDFGSSRSGKKICGKVEDSSTTLTHKTDYTQLFKDAGGKTAHEGSGGAFGDWKDTCDSKWEIGGSSDSEQMDADNLNKTEQSLGLCSGTSQQDNDIPFAHKKDNDGISVCVGLINCGQLQSRELQQKQKLESQDESKGKTVTFYESN